MSPAQLVISIVSFTAQVALLLGLVRRRHYRNEPFFVLYVATVFLSNAAVMIWYRWDVWLVHQAVTAAVRFGVALGLTYGVFRQFPTAASTARWVLFLVLVATLTAAFSLAGADAGYADASAQLVSRIATGTVWLFTAMAALVLWYRLPLRGLQKAILLGLSPYLLVFTVAMNLLSSIGWQVRLQVGYADTLAFMSLMIYWTVVAWRPAEDAVVRPAGLQKAPALDVRNPAVSARP
jgi:hypothetical protein